MRTNESYCKAKPVRKTKAIICVFSFWTNNNTEIEIRPKNIVIEWNVVKKMVFVKQNDFSGFDTSVAR